MLQRGGHEVRFLLRRDYEAMAENGLRVTSPRGGFHLEKVRCYRSSAEMGEVDLVLVGLKTFANEALIPLIAPLAASGSAILTLQNGLGNEELLAAAFGADRVLGGVAFLCSNRGEPGTVHHLAQGSIRLGEFSGALSSRAREFAAAFTAAGVPCEAVADLVKARWEKLVWNIPFNGLCALTGHATNALLAHPPSRQLIMELMTEVVAGAEAQGLSTPISGPAFIARMISLTEEMGAYRPSMMIDRLEGRPLELSSIYGIPLQRATGRGVEMVRVQMLHALLDGGSRGDREEDRQGTKTGPGRSRPLF
jgi:2-dehydropantoate 2-reductase